MAENQGPREAESETDESSLAGSSEFEHWDAFDRKTELLAESTRNFVKETRQLAPSVSETELMSEAIVVAALEFIGKHGPYPINRRKLLQIVEERFDLPPDSSQKTADFETIRREVGCLMDSAMEEGFEAGSDNEFSRELTHMVCLYGDLALEAIRELIFDRSARPEVAEETLRTLGRLWDRRTYLSRRSLLEDSLTFPSVHVRAGAVHALASLRDPHAIDTLRSAAKDEPDELVRKTMKRAVELLRRTQLGSSAAASTEQSKTPQV